MRVFYAGTGESYDFELTLLVLVVFFALVVIISWGVPSFRNYLKLRREAQKLAAEALTEHEEDPQPENDESWSSVLMQ